MYSRQELAEGFRTLGVVPGDTVMLHASIRSVGPVAGGPDQIHLALKDALTPEGTLLMYASCPDHYDEIGLGSLTADQERELIEKLPPFDPYTARSQRDNGALVELLRTSPGALVNPHVVRFVAWGRQSLYLFRDQPWSYAYGKGSALDRLAALDGRILMLGADHDTATFLHYAEHIADIPDKKVVRYRVPVEEDGARTWKDTEEFDTSDAGAHPHWPARFFARIVDTYLANTGNTGGRVGNARAVLFDARGLLELALRMMKAVAADRNAAAALTKESSWA